MGMPWEYVRNNKASMFGFLRQTIVPSNDNEFMVLIPIDHRLIVSEGYKFAGNAVLLRNADEIITSLCTECELYEVNNDWCHICKSSEILIACKDTNVCKPMPRDMHWYYMQVQDAIGRQIIDQAVDSARMEMDKMEAEQERMREQLRQAHG